MNRILVVALASALIFACSPPSAQDVAKSTATQTSALVNEAALTAQAVNGLSSISALTNGFNATRSAFYGVPLSGSVPDGGISTPPAPQPAPTAPSTDPVDAGMNDLAQYLENEIFIDSNVESKSGNSVTFLIPGDKACDFPNTTTVDPSCVQEVNDIQIRIRATEQGSQSNIDLTLIIGPAKNEPLTFKLRPTSIAIDFNLPEMQASANYLKTLSEFSKDNWNVPGTMQGVVELMLQKNADKDFTFSSSVLTAVDVAVTDSQGATREFTTAAASPVQSVRLAAGPPVQLSYEMALGPTTYSAPYKPDFSASGLAGTKMTFSLSGFSYQFSAEEGQQSFTVGHVGLGDAQSTVSLDGTTLFAADLNALSGRHFDVTVQPASDGQPIISVSPEFDLKTLFFLQPLTVDGTVASYYQNETYEVHLSGSSPSIKPVASTATFPGGLEVLSGSLAISTTEAGVEPVVVNAGSCLVGNQTVPDGGHPILGALGVTSCP